jgi:hypothetical protein
MSSPDRGRTWQVHEYAKINTTESQVAETAPGELMLNMRDNRGTGRAVYVTKDLGRTWAPHVSDGQLVEPICMASLLKVPVSLVVDVLNIFQVCDPYMRRHDVIVHPLLEACQQIWKRYGNMDLRQLASYATELRAYYL